jgi:DHA1 family multidrug resistance protein-like MFS transporter
MNKEAADMGADYTAHNLPYWRRNLAVAVVGSFATALNLSMLLPFLPLYVRELGVEAPAAVMQWSGLAFGATFLGVAVTAPIWGRLADRYGRKAMLVRAALGMAVVMPLVGLAQNVEQLVALRLAAGLIGGYASAATVMIGTQAPPERAGWALGILSSGALAGNLLGPLVGGFLPAWLGMRGSLFAGGAVIAVAAVATILLVRERFEPLQDRAGAAAAPVAVPAAGAMAQMGALFLTAAMVLVANMSIEPIITLYVAQLGAGADSLTKVAGGVMAASALGSVLTAPLLGRLADRHGAAKVIVGCLVATALVMLPQALVQHWWQLAVLRVAMGMSLAGLLPAITKQVRLTAPAGGSGRLLGYLQSAQFSGQVVGPMIGAWVGGYWGMRQVFVATSLLLLLCALAQRLVRPGVVLADPALHE